MLTNPQAQNPILKILARLAKPNNLRLVLYCILLCGLAAWSLEQFFGTKSIDRALEANQAATAKSMLETKLTFGGGYDLKLRLARANIALGDLETAQEIIESALVKDPNNPQLNQTVLYLAREMKGAEQLEGIVPLLEQVDKAVCPACKELLAKHYTLQGRQALRARNLAAGLELLQRAFSLLAAQEGDASRLLGRKRELSFTLKMLADQSKDPQEALSYYRQALEYMDSPALRLKVGQMLLKTQTSKSEDLDEALSNLSAAYAQGFTEAKTDHARALGLLAKALEGEGKSKAQIKETLASKALISPKAPQKAE